MEKIEIAIQACEASKKNLVIIGEGPDLERLKAYSNKYTRFEGYVSEERKSYLLANCDALLVTQYEDFGITPLEGMAFGKPVLAYGKGGVLETVLPGVTGEFFKEQTSKSLQELIDNFDLTKYNSDTCRGRSYEFRKEVFTENLSKCIDSVYLKDH